MVEIGQSDTKNTVKATEEYLTFLMDGEEYGVDILSVQEIRGWSAVRAIPNTPSYIKGVIDLRGVIVPIIDMRERFGLKQEAYDHTTVVIVINTSASNGQTVQIGIVVDAVSEVYNLKTAQIKKTPNFGTKIDTKYIRGMASTKDKMILLLDVQRLMAPEELDAMQELID